MQVLFGAGFVADRQELADGHPEHDEAVEVRQRDDRDRDAGDEADGIPILLDISEAALAHAARELQTEYRECTLECCQVDITDNSGMENICEDILRKYGRIDALINNAANNPGMDGGSGNTAGTRFENFPAAVWERDIAVGLTGAFFCAQVFGGAMAARGKGRDGENVSVALNRATPSKQEILDVFGGRVGENTVVLCDSNQSHGVLEDKCTVATTKRINKVNGFHSFIKERLNAARGVATIYLNRYNALFAKIYAADQSVVDDIFELMTSRAGRFRSISHTQSVDLLIV